MPPREPSPGTICTGDEISPVVRFEFFAPSDQWILDAIFGFFADYVWPSKFSFCGEVNPDQAAAAFSAMLPTIRRSLLNVGAVIAYAGDLPVDPSILACDGTSYLRDDYPDLFAAIGTTWGADDSTHFNVPDLRTRTLVMSGVAPSGAVWNVGDLIGEEEHTLTTAEMPSHSHTDAGHTHLDAGHTHIDAGHAHAEGSAIPAVGAAIVGVPIPSAIPTPSVTAPANANILSGSASIQSGSANNQSTGGDDAHNNTQLSGVINYAIIAI